MSALSDTILTSIKDEPAPKLWNRLRVRLDAPWSGRLWFRETVIDEVKLWLRKRHCLRAKQLATTFRYHHHPRPPPPPRASERRDSMPVDMENAILVAAAFILVLLLPYVDKQRSHTSRSAGERYTQELLACGNERRIQENLRMERSVFLKLCAILKVVDKWVFYIKDLTM
jgi:hypothetical protein